MPCANRTYAFPIAPAPTPAWLGQPTLMEVITVIAAAWREARDMQRAGRRQYPFSE
jgi:hypothetical protein